MTSENLDDVVIEEGSMAERGLDIHFETDGETHRPACRGDDGCGATVDSEEDRQRHNRWHSKLLVRMEQLADSHRAGGALQH